MGRLSHLWLLPVLAMFLGASVAYAFPAPRAQRGFRPAVRRGLGNGAQRHTLTAQEASPVQQTPGTGLARPGRTALPRHPDAEAAALADERVREATQRLEEARNVLGEAVTRETARRAEVTARIEANKAALTELDASIRSVARTQSGSGRGATLRALRRQRRAFVREQNALFVEREGVRARRILTPFPNRVERAEGEILATRPHILGRGMYVAATLAPFLTYFLQGDIGAVIGATVASVLALSITTVGMQQSAESKREPFTSYELLPTETREARIALRATEAEHRAARDAQTIARARVQHLPPETVAQARRAIRHESLRALPTRAADLLAEGNLPEEANEALGTIRTRLRSLGRLLPTLDPESREAHEVRVLLTEDLAAAVQTYRKIPSEMRDAPLYDGPSPTQRTVSGLENVADGLLTMIERIGRDQAHENAVANRVLESRYGTE